MDTMGKRAPLYVILACGVLVPLGGHFLIADLLPRFLGIHLPLHSTMEGLGGFAGILLALLLFSLHRDASRQDHYPWLASGLLVMGALDGLHAAVGPGERFVWLHSAATLFGGLLFALSWLPFHGKLPRALLLLLCALASVAAMVGLFSVAVPPMIHNGSFTAAARMMNAVGGLGFLLAAARLVSIGTTRGGSETYLFVTFCALFGGAGVAFTHSTPWDGPWWWWHLMRLTAYLVVLGVVVRVYHNLRNESVQDHAQLEEMLDELRRFHGVTAERELALKALREENTVLRAEVEALQQRQRSVV